MTKKNAEVLYFFPRQDLMCFRLSSDLLSIQGWPHVPASISSALGLQAQSTTLSLWDTGNWTWDFTQARKAPYQLSYTQPESTVVIWEEFIEDLCVCDFLKSMFRRTALPNDDGFSRTRQTKLAVYNNLNCENES